MKTMTIAAAASDPSISGLQVYIQCQNKTKVELHIPFTLMFTDMFNRGVLAPKSEKLFFTKDDDRALIAHTYINTQTEGQAPDFATVQQILPANLLLSAVVYRELLELTDTYIENVLLEMETEEPDLDAHIFFMEMIERCTPKVNAFMQDTMLKLEGESQIKLYQSILKPYAAIANRAAEHRSKVTYHPEVLNV